MAEVQSVTIQISHSFEGVSLLLHYPASEMAGVAVAHTGRGAIRSWMARLIFQIERIISKRQRYHFTLNP